MFTTAFKIRLMKSSGQIVNDIKSLAIIASNNARMIVAATVRS